MGKPKTYRSVVDYGDHVIQVKLTEHLGIKRKMIKHFHRNTGAVYLNVDLVVFKDMVHFKRWLSGRDEYDKFWTFETKAGSIQAWLNIKFVLGDLISKVIPKYDDDVCIIVDGSDQRRHDIYSRALKRYGFKEGTIPNHGWVVHKWYNQKTKIKLLA